MNTQFNVAPRFSSLRIVANGALRQRNGHYNFDNCTDTVELSTGDPFEEGTVTEGRTVKSDDDTIYLNGHPVAESADIAAITQEYRGAIKLASAAGAQDASTLKTRVQDALSTLPGVCFIGKLPSEFRREQLEKIWGTNWGNTMKQRLTTALTHASIKPNTPDGVNMDMPDGIKRAQNAINQGVWDGYAVSYRFAGPNTLDGRTAC